MTPIQEVSINLVINSLEFIVNCVKNPEHDRESLLNRLGNLHSKFLSQKEVRGAIIVEQLMELVPPVGDTTVVMKDSTNGE